MQFRVPQFLEIEDKIFGPFTFREFVYLAGGGGLCFILYRLLGLFWGFIPILIIAGFSLALVFYKPNDKPFINMVEASFNYIFKNKLYIWQKKENIIKRNQINKVNENQNRVELNKLNKSKLRDLAWSLDILDLNKHENLK